MISIGCRYTGKNYFRDTENGTYWEALPEIMKDERIVQRMLLAKEETFFSWLKGVFHG